MESNFSIKIGEKAPDFTLKDNRNHEINLSEFLGKKVLLSWHPLAWTSVCAQQMQNLEKVKPVFDELNTVALGISIDTVPSKNAWAKKLEISETKLLSDFWPHGRVARLYGLFREKEGFTQRANVIIDENMQISFVKIYDIPQLPDLEEIIIELKK